MNMRFGGWLLSLCLLMASACGGDPEAPCDCPADAVINCGHRGTGTNAPNNPFPENTLPSFVQAEAEGADMVELDVQHSSDGALVVIHDDTVDRTTDGAGCVADHDLAALQAMDGAVGTSMEGQAVVIPTFDQVLAGVALPINIEIKINEMVTCPVSNKDALAADVVAAIRGDASARAHVVSSFDLEMLEKVQALDPDIPLGYLTVGVSGMTHAVSGGFASLNLFDLTLTEEDVANIAAEGLDVNVWTVNQRARLSFLLTAGVNMIITDEPDLLDEVRLEHCAGICPPLPD